MKRTFAACLFLFTAACNVSDDGPALGNNANNANNANNGSNNATNNTTNNTTNNANNMACDECGVCDDDTTNDCVQDCAGEWGGDAMEDACGTCDADPENDCVADCAGTPGGDAMADMCGTCDEDPNNDCVQDCAGEWGGMAVADACGTCDADATNDCVQDCNNVWGGEATVDGCGRCSGGDTNLTPCTTTSFSPVEDAYVLQSGSDTNYGTLNELIVDSGTGYIFVKFDLSSLPTDIAVRSVRFGGTVFQTQSFGGTGDIQILMGAEDSWKESEITWNNKGRIPVATTFGTFNVAGATAGSDTSVEVVDNPDMIRRVQDEVWGDKTLTFILTSEYYRANFYARETPDAAKHFQLELSYDELKSTDIAVVADTYVSALSPNKSFGADTLLNVDPQGSSNANPPEWAMVKFNLANIPDGVQIERAMLSMYADRGFAYGGDGTCYTYLLDNDTWDENTVNYNSAPTWQPTAIGSWWLWFNNTTPGQWGHNGARELVAPIVDAYGTDKLISFRLASTGYRTNYRSREFTDATLHPRLKVWYYQP